MAQEADEQLWKLIQGYCREQSEDMNVIQDIIAIIYEYHRKRYEILKFEADYKAPNVKLCDDNTLAQTTTNNSYWILAGGDPVTQGIAVWRIKVCFL